MLKVNFIPQWYRKEKDYRKVKSFKVYITLFVILNMFLVGKIIYDKNVLVNLKGNIEKKEEYSHIEVKNNFKSINNMKMIDDFARAQIEFYDENISFYNVVLEKNIMKLEINAYGIDAYLNFIEKVEKKKGYKILNFSDLEKKPQGYQFTIELEVI